MVPLPPLVEVFTLKDHIPQVHRGLRLITVIKYLYLLLVQEYILKRYLLYLLYQGGQVRFICHYLHLPSLVWHFLRSLRIQIRKLMMSLRKYPY